jgi:hypothetical protein
MPGLMDQTQANMYTGGMGGFPFVPGNKGHNNFHTDNFNEYDIEEDSEEDDSSSDDDSVTTKSIENRERVSEIIFN